MWNRSFCYTCCVEQTLLYWGITGAVLSDEDGVSFGIFITGTHTLMCSWALKGSHTTADTQTVQRDGTDSRSIDWMKAESFAPGGVDGCKRSAVVFLWMARCYYRPLWVTPEPHLGTAVETVPLKIFNMIHRVCCASQPIVCRCRFISIISLSPNVCLKTLQNTSSLHFSLFHFWLKLLTKALYSTILS